MIIRLFAFVFTLSLCYIVPAMSQPPSDSALANWDTARKAWADLLVKNADLEKADPAAAAALYGQFLHDHPQLSSSTAVGAARYTAALYAQAKQVDKAIELDGAMYITNQTFGDSWTLLFQGATLLNGANRQADAEKVLKANWTTMVGGGAEGANQMAKLYISTLEAEDKKDLAVTEMRAMLMERPMFLDDENRYDQWLTYQLVSDLVFLQREDEALGWAKVRFMECKFAENDITGATNQLVSVWNAKTMSQVASQAFMEAQKDTTKPNPLADVKPPVVSDDEKRILLAHAQGPGMSHARVSAYILLGQWRQAMGAAKQSVVEQQGAGGAQEVCRVFKAADLNVNRANTFLEFFKTGTGVNPLGDFFKQYAN